MEHKQAYIQQTLKANWFYKMAELSDFGSILYFEFIQMAKFADCVAVEHLNMMNKLDQLGATIEYFNAKDSGLNYWNI